MFQNNIKVLWENILEFFSEFICQKKKDQSRISHMLFMSIDKLSQMDHMFPLQQDEVQVT